MTIPVSQDNALTVRADWTAFIPAASNPAVGDASYPDSAITIASALSLIAASAIPVGLATGFTRAHS